MTTQKSPKVQALLDRVSENQACDLYNEFQKIGGLTGFDGLDISDRNEYGGWNKEEYYILTGLNRIQTYHFWSKLGLTVSAEEMTDDLELYADVVTEWLDTRG